MNIAFGCDHAGYNHRKDIIDFLKKRSYNVTDFGCDKTESCDYPEIAIKVAKTVSEGKCERGILICGTGIGVSITANKFKGIRAAVCWNDKVASLISEHNNANIICLPGRFATTEEMSRWIEIWLNTPVSKEKRHLDRLKMITDIE
ncbi:ribose 5-phosphate isomerase B [Elusimicrobiota bacterium]